MAQGRTIDVDRLVDEQKLTRFNWLLVLWCFIITLIDGYDISAAPAAGPFFVREWHLASPAALTFAFSATNFGVLFGAPLFGFIGDRYGRKPAILLSLVVFGLFTLLVAFATSVEHLTWARFLTGFGVGGVIANTIALNAEMAPQRVRATLIILMFVGTTLGGIFPPIVANTLAAAHGWQIIFWIGGIIPFVIAAICWFVLPESIKYLALMPARRAEAVAIAQKMRPGLVIDADDRFASASEHAARARFIDLFAGRLAIVTPLLWLLFAINLMVFYFVNVWLQTIVTPAILKAGGSAATAQNASLMFQLGGTICALAMCRFVDKMGLRPVVLLILLGMPATAAIGYFATSPLLVWVTARRPVRPQCHRRHRLSDACALARRGLCLRHRPVRRLRRPGARRHAHRHEPAAVEPLRDRGDPADHLAGCVPDHDPPARGEGDAGRRGSASIMASSLRRRSRAARFGTRACLPLDAWSAAT
jgi:AAHS family 4-hydroxybenzoate transporter-like MFS transporter